MATNDLFIEMPEEYKETAEFFIGALSEAMAKEDIRVLALPPEALERVERELTMVGPEGKRIIEYQYGENKFYAIIVASSDEIANDKLEAIKNTGKIL